MRCFWDVLRCKGEIPMCKNKDRDGKNGMSQKIGTVKEWVLFFGELVKASVDGVVEFWGKTDDAGVVVEPVEAEYGEIPVELDYEECSDEEDCDVEDCEEEDEETAPSARELKQQARLMKQIAKQAKKEEDRARKAEKQLEKAEKKERKQAADAEKKREKDEKKTAEKQEKARKKEGYVSKNVILSETEKHFLDGIKSAVGLRYIVKPRVALADVLKRGDGTKCRDEQLGEMDFGVFDLQLRLKVLVEVRGMKRRGKPSQKAYKKVRKLCKKAGIPIVTFWAKYGVLPDYIKERMQDYLNV